MRYEKPVVMDLSAGARATGQGPLGCYDGVSATTPGEGCWVGSGGIALQPCWAGAVPNTIAPADCIGGGIADPAYCEAGPVGLIDPDGCRVGPSVMF